MDIDSYFLNFNQKIVYIGMAISACPAGTQPGLTSMGRILLGPIKNRVGYRIKKKKK